MALIQIFEKTGIFDLFKEVLGSRVSFLGQPTNHHAGIQVMPSPRDDTCQKNVTNCAVPIG